MVPRIRGRVGQIETHTEEKYVGKWLAELFIGFLGEGDPVKQGKEPDFVFGPFDTEKEAQDQLSKAAREACEAAEQAMTGEKSGQFVDMKDDQLKEWDTGLKPGLEVH